MPLRSALSCSPALSRRAALRTIAGGAIAAAGVHSARGQVRTTAARTYQERINFGAKAVHLDPRKSTPDYLLSLVDMIDRTELNALVIDIKEDGVYYGSDVALFRDNGVLVPLFDVSELIGLMHDHGIYTIARLVTFKDPILAERRPDLAVGDIGGGIWRDQAGFPWLNPFNEEVWAANAALAAEAARYGFDEIQLDYVRFPTDGNLSRMVFGQPLTQESRQNAIMGYIQVVQDSVRPHGAALGADIFGWTLVVDDDNGIGQNAVQIAPEVDFFCPMVYPSHWPYGSLNLPGHPNDFPYQTIEITMELATAKLPTQVKKVRPWLQAFTLPGMKTYTASDIQAQIDAAEDTGIEGWMFWNFGNPYPADAFRPG